MAIKDVQGSKGFKVTLYKDIAERDAIPLGDRLGDKLGNRLGDKLGDKQKHILRIVGANPKVSISQLSKMLGISQTAIENNIKKLRNAGIIHRVGPARGGHWEVRS